MAGQGIGALGSTAFEAAKDVGKLGLYGVALAPFAAGAVTGAVSAKLNAPTTEDIGILRKQELAVTYRRLAEQIRERIKAKEAAQ